MQFPLSTCQLVNSSTDSLSKTCETKIHNPWPDRLRSSPYTAMASRGPSASSRLPPGRTIRDVYRQTTPHTGWRPAREWQQKRYVLYTEFEPVRTQGRKSCPSGAPSPSRPHILSATVYRQTVGKQQPTPWHRPRLPRLGSPPQHLI